VSAVLIPNSDDSTRFAARRGLARHHQPQRIAAVLAEGGDVVVRSAWRNGRWLDQTGEAFDFIAAFASAKDGLIDLPVQLCRKGNTPLHRVK
jgi:hypothetical protein